MRIILAGKENDIAWETFTGGPVGTQRWLETAAVRGKTHPRDAIALYHGLLPVAAAVRATPGDEAFEIVQAIGMLRARLDEHAEFASELEGIRRYPEFRV
ncbi:zinc finger SWIM domain-containing protein [Burkholderia pseudomallei]|nr:zinc finger SWIM domain-containing protein [Burkholderia pseudomallei]